jgi:hypothetical protein
MTLAVTHCPVCEGRVKLQARESRLHTVYGFPTIKRRRFLKNYVNVIKTLKQWEICFYQRGSKM